MKFVLDQSIGVVGELEAQNGQLRRQLLEQKQWHSDCVERWLIERESLTFDKEQAEARASIAEEELRAAHEELDGIKGRADYA